MDDYYIERVSIINCIDELVYDIVFGIGVYVFDIFWIDYTCAFFFSWENEINKREKCSRDIFEFCEIRGCGELIEIFDFIRELKMMCFILFFNFVIL
jgi:hypothetical protein